MRLSEVEVESFRSIKSCKIRFGEITAIVGENNAGKSALLRALNSVFNWEFEETSFFNNAHQYSPRTVSKITICFDEVPHRETYDGKRNGEKLSLRFTYSYSNSARKRTLACITSDTIIPVDESFINELKRDIDYVYIPAGRGNNDLAWKDNSILMRVLTSYSQYYTQSRDNISAQTARVANSLKTQIFSKIEVELKKSSMFDAEEMLNFDYLSALDYTIFLSKVGVTFCGKGKDFAVTECGSGIKSLSVIALYRALAKINGVNVILGIEEPEKNLHPHAQKKLIASIKNERDDSEVQAIMATHSTVIVDELGHEDIVLARRVADSKRGFYTKYTQLTTDFWSRYSLDIQKHNMFFRYKNSDFFFSKYAIITESSIDAEVIRVLVENAVGSKIFYVSILNLDGVRNLKYPYSLLNSLEIPFSMVVDKDMLTEYKNQKLDESRNAETHLPEYKNVVKRSDPVVKDIWRSEDKLSELSDLLSSSYKKLFDFTKEKNLYPMQYSLEMDLVASEKSRQKFCEVMDIPFDDNASKILLIEKKKAIKDLATILQVVTNLEPKDYPYSYKKIRKEIADQIARIY